MFYGSYNYSLDDKGRLVVPAKLRSDLGSEVVLTKGYDGCLSMYPVGEFEKMLLSLRSLPFEKSNLRVYTRSIAYEAERLMIDKSGRITIPPEMLKNFNFVKDVVIAGALDHIEIWAKEIYEEYQKHHENEFETVAEDIPNLYEK